VVFTVGIGMASAIFAVTEPFLVRSLPYRNADDLVVILLRPDREQIRGVRPIAPPATLADWRRRTNLFVELAGYGELEHVRLRASDGTVIMTVRAVSPNLLPLLGIETAGLPVAGPPFESGSVDMVLTAGAALDRLRSSGAELVGTSVREMGGTGYWIRAVLGRGFVFPHPDTRARPDSLVVVEPGPLVTRDQNSIKYLTAIGRVVRGITPGELEAALNASVADSGLRVTAFRLVDYMTADQRPLAGAGVLVAAMIVLICAANGAGLTVSRTVYRAGEFATRRALGASTPHLIRLVFFDLAAMGIVSVLMGLLVARALLALIAGVMPEEYQSVGRPDVGVSAVLFASSVGFAMMIACVAAALGTSRVSRLATTGLSAVETGRWRIWRFAMTAAQAAIALLLVIGATLLIRSHVNMWMQTVGYSAGARVVSVSYPASAEGGVRLRDDVEKTIEALRLIPTVTGVAAGIRVGSLFDEMSTIGGPTIRAGSQVGRMMPAEVTRDYFSVVGTRMLAGRSFSPDDGPSDVIVINRSFAAEAWPGTVAEELVGRVVVVGASTRRIVGVTEDTHDRGLDEGPVQRLYVPLDLEAGVPRRVNYFYRATEADVPEISLRRSIGLVQHQAVVESVNSVGGRLRESVRDKTFIAIVLTVFAIAATALTSVGIAALVSFVVARRTREIAIRMAIGADGKHVRRLVVHDAFMATLMGATIGAVLGRGLSRGLESQLYGVDAGDAGTLLLAVAVMLATAVVAAWLPVRKALRVRPTMALRLD